MSQRKLNPDEESVLKLGLNFSIAPKSVPKEVILQQIEPALWNLSSTTGNIIRAQASETLHHAKPPEKNLSRKEQNAINTLRKDHSIHILKADKGNATVIMSKTGYEDKVKDILSSNTYNKLKRDPTPSIERKVTQLTLKKKNSISPNLYRRLHRRAQNFIVYLKSTNPEFRFDQSWHQEAHLPIT